MKYLRTPPPCVSFSSLKYRWASLYAVFLSANSRISNWEWSFVYKTFPLSYSHPMVFLYAYLLYAKHIVVYLSIAYNEVHLYWFFKLNLPWTIKLIEENVVWSLFLLTGKAFYVPKASKQSYKEMCKSKTQRDLGAAWDLKERLPRSTNKILPTVRSNVAKTFLNRNFSLDSRGVLDPLVVHMFETPLRLEVFYRLSILGSKYRRPSLFAVLTIRGRKNNRK